ncbi:MAG: plastocyanin/azurin family copper-binding protein [Bacteroidota bacterium]
MKNYANRGATLFHLYELLLNHPWDLEVGEYRYFCTPHEMLGMKATLKR